MLKGLGSQRLVALFAGGWVLFNFPLLALWDHERRLWGLPLFPSALFLIWAALIAALAIRIDSPGPILYRQERVGLHGRIFHVVKFRSMRTDAEKDGVPKWATAADSRVTRVGRIIRKLRIDELPQLFGVLKGDMSLVGPRPERAFFVEKLTQEIPFYAVRHSVKPGVIIKTCLFAYSLL